MKNESNLYPERKTGQSVLLALGLTVLFFAGIVLLYDFTYGVIDDPFIATVLNGAYTGTPDAHVVYIKYPLAWILKTLFGLVPSVNWHFLLLEGCFFTCFFIVNFRICSRVKKISSKILFCLLFMLCFWLCMGKMILTAHYSMCAGTLAATGIFYFATIRYDASKKELLLNGIVTLLMLWTAYGIRARTVFMLLPIAGGVFLYKFFRKRPFFTKENFVRWLVIPVFLFIGLGGIELLHNAQYKSEEWKAFLVFNDARTTLYDFYGLPEYEKNRELYESLNVSGARQYMYEKYYLELTDGTDENMLPKIAEARVAEYAEEVPMGARIGKTLKALPLNLIQKTYAPVNWICAASFIIILLIAALMAKWRVFSAVLGGAVLSLVPWLWMIYMGKPTSRVTMGIWTADLLFLIAILIDNCEEIRQWVNHKREQGKKWTAKALGYLAAAVLAAALLAGIATGYSSLKKNLSETIASGDIRSALETWCESQPQYLYICESEIVNGLGFNMKKVDNSLQNLYWPGGWPAKMAQSKAIWERFHIEDIEKAIVENENVYIIAFTDTNMSYWTDFYKEAYPAVSLTEMDQLELEGASFTIYQLHQ